MKRLKFLWGRVGWGVWFWGGTAVSMVALLTVGLLFPDADGPWVRGLMLPMFAGGAMSTALGVWRWIRGQLTEYEEPPEPLKPGVSPDPWGES